MTSPQRLKSTGPQLADQRLIGKTKIGAPPKVLSKRLDFVKQVRAGFSYTVLDALAKKLGISQEQIIVLLNLPRSTIKRQQSEGRPFSAEHSDRMYRAQKLIDMSAETLGDPAEAVRWLQRQHTALGGVTALSLVDTTAGYERVLDELERITHGVPV